MEKNCIYCGKALPLEARFCDSCGKPQPEQNAEQTVQEAAPIATATAEQPAAEPKKKKDKKFVLGLVKNATILALSLVMFIMAFLPITSIDFSEDNVEVSVGISAVDSMGFLFDAMSSVDEEDLLDSDLYEEIEEIYEDFYEEAAKADDYDDLSSKGKAYLADLVKLGYSASLQSEDSNVFFTPLMSALFSFVYFMASIALLVVAVFNFIASFGVFASKKEKLYKATLWLLAAMPVLAMVAHFALFTQLGAGGFSMLGMGAAASDVSFGGGALTTIILSVLAIVGITVLAFIFKEHKQKFNIVARSIALGIAILFVCFSFAPVLSFSITGEFDGKSKKQTASIGFDYSDMAALELKESELEELEEFNDYYSSRKEKKAAFKSGFQEFLDYSVKEIDNGEANELHREYVVGLLAAETDESTPTIFVIVAVLASITIGFMGVLIWQLNICFMLGDYSKKLYKMGKITGGVLALVTVGLVALFFGLVLIAVLDFTPKDYSVSLGFGAIVTAVLAIATFCIPMDKKAKAVKTPEAE